MPIPPEVATELLGVVSGNDKYLFWNRGSFGGNESPKRGRDGNETTAVTAMQTDLRNLFRATGLTGRPAHGISSFANTFAVSLLSAGVPLEEVAKMLGNSIKVCERHYGKWVQSRQDRLDSLVIGTFKKTKKSKK